MSLYSNNMTKPNGIAIRLLGKEYQVSCPNGQEHSLMDAAYLLNQKMTEVKNNSRVIGLERIAIMTALNLANEILAIKSDKEKADYKIKSKLEYLEQKFDNIYTVHS